MSSITASLNEFTSSYRGKLHTAAVALAKGDEEPVSNLVENIKESVLVQQLTAQISTSTEKMNEFLTRLRAVCEQAKKASIIYPLAVGLATLAGGTTAVATTLGVSVVLVQVVAVCCVLWGIVGILNIIIDGGLEAISKQ